MKQSKTEMAYNTLSKDFSFDKRFEAQKEIIQKEFEQIALSFGYISGAEAFRTMRTYHRKIKGTK